MNSKFRDILEDVGSYILVGIVTIGLIIMYGVSRASIFNWTFFSLGLSLTAVPVIGYLLYSKLSENQNDSNHKNYINKLKKIGNQINVNLTECEIKSNNWSHQIEKYSDPRIQFLNGISGYQDKNIERIDNNSCVIIYHTHCKGQKRSFKSGTISKDDKSLKMLIELQKTTSIFVDPNNPKYYYFDLEFLKNG